MDVRHTLLTCSLALALRRSLYNSHSQSHCSYCNAEGKSRETKARKNQQPLEKQENESATKYTLTLAHKLLSSNFRYQIYSDSTFRKKPIRKRKLLPFEKQLPLNSYHTQFFYQFSSHCFILRHTTKFNC